MSSAISHHEAGKQRRNNVSPRGWIVLRLLVAVILLFAAGMKAWQLATSPSLSDGLLHARWFNILVVEFELAFAIWLLLGVLPRWTRLATIGLFSVFASVSLYKALSGESSCGCFGEAQVNPWMTTTLDAAIVGALLYCRNVRTMNRAFSIKRIAIAVVLWTIASAPLLYAFGSVEKNDLSALGTEFIGADGRKTVLLEPERWTNGEFPLLPYIEPAEVREQLKTGKWTVVLYRDDCPHCTKTIADLASKGTPRVVCIEVPPYGGGGKVPVGFVHAKLTDKLAWFVQTPTKVILDK